MELDLGIKKELEDINLFSNEVKSTSDRTCAIVAAAFLDNSIQNILLSFLTEGSKTQNDSLFSQNGPLANFSSKITLSYRLGLISKFEYDNLNLIRKIRNYFAHDLSVNSFECKCCKELLAQHIPDEDLLLPLNIPISYSNNEKPETLLPEEFAELVFDENRYAKVLPNFPAPKYPILDKNSMRSIFMCIVFILQASLNSRRLEAIIECRQRAKDFKDIVDVEKFKIDFVEKRYKDHTERLDILKRETILRIEEVEKKLSSSNNEDLMQLKVSLYERLKEIEELILESHMPKTIDNALVIHTYKYIEYNKSKQ